MHSTDSNIGLLERGGLALAKSGLKTSLIEFLSSLTQFILATFIPLYLGMLFVIILEQVARVSIRNLSAFALGLLFWFFLDTLNDAIQLGVNEGFSFDFRHAALLLLFIIGFLALALLGGRGVSAKVVGKEASSLRFLVVILAALGMGFHGIGEGMEFGGTSAGTSAIAILDAIGGYGGAIAYVLHKFLEAFIVTIVFVALMSDDGLSFRKQLWRHGVGTGLWNPICSGRSCRLLCSYGFILFLCPWRRIRSLWLYLS